MQWPSSWADRASSSLDCTQLGWEEGAPKRVPSGMWGVFLTSMGICGFWGVPKLEHLPLVWRVHEQGGGLLLKRGCICKPPSQGVYATVCPWGKVMKDMLGLVLEGDSEIHSLRLVTCAWGIECPGVP